MRRIAVSGFASGADSDHDDPDKSRRAQSAPATQRRRQKPLLTDDVMARRLTALENRTPSTVLVPVRKFLRANVHYLVPDIANDRTG